MHTRRWAAAAAAGALVTSGLLAAPSSAAPPEPIQVTFTDESPGPKPNGYASAESPGLLFYDTMGANLSVGDYGAQSHGLGLLVGSDDASALEVRLTGPTTAISMAFGNDDPAYVNATDQAALTVYRNATQVGQVTVNVNANDVMDQTIGYSGRVFNRATFQYVNAAGVPVGLIEIVDDITVNPLCTVVGDERNNRLTGTAGPDVICGDTGDDTIQAGGGDDLVYPGGGNDTTDAGAGADAVFDSGGNDFVNGKGADDVRGGSGNDTVRGGSGRDRVNGGPGKDRLDGGPAVDRCDGGPGRDTARSCEQRSRIP